MSRAIMCLWLLALVQLVALVVVSVVQHFNMADLLKSENEVREMLVDLITRKIAESNLNVPHAPDQHGLRSKREVNNDLKLDGFEFILREMLAAQENVIQNHCNNATKVCPQGPKGESGIIGVRGPQGLKGEPGREGVKGVTGAVGLKGVSGSPGLDGPVGAAGNAGATGASGPPGDKGSRGEKGEVGHQGPIGADGAAGNKGEVGPVGPQGPQGAKGSVGPAGPVGDMGPKGQQGSKGPAGPAGDPGMMQNVNCECLKMPKIREFASSIAVTLGLPFHLTCEADGNPSPSILWSVGTGNVLSFDHIQDRDLHAYTCTARSTLGLDTKSVTLTKP